MKIVSFMHTLRLFILDDGSSISVDGHDGFRVGVEIELVDGEYKLAQSAEMCEA